MRRFMLRKARPVPINVLLGILFVVLMAVIIFIAYRQLTGPPNITDYKSCIAAGQPVLDSYPEQCVYQGQSYINPAQNIPKPY